MSGSVITPAAEGAANWVVLDAITPAPLPPVRPALERAIRDTAVTYPRCRCVLHARLTDDELVRLGAGCTDPLFACPRLDTVRRRVL